MFTCRWTCATKAGVASPLRHLVMPGVDAYSVLGDACLEAGVALTARRADDPRHEGLKAWIIAFGRCQLQSKVSGLYAIS